MADTQPLPDANALSTPEGDNEQLPEEPLRREPRPERPRGNEPHPTGPDRPVA